MTHFATWLRQLDHEVETLRTALLALQRHLEQQGPRAGTASRPAGSAPDEYLRAYV